MKIRALAAALLVAAAVSAPAAADPAHGPRPQFGPAQKAEMLRAHKARVHEAYQERIAILEQADACIQAAETHDAFRACREAEKSRREALKERRKNERDGLRGRHDALRGEHGR